MGFAEDAHTNGSERILIILWGFFSLPFLNYVFSIKIN